MGNSGSIPSFPSVGEITNSVTSSVSADIKSAVKVVSESFSSIAADMPIHTFLKLPLMNDIMQFTGDDIIDDLIAIITRGMPGDIAAKAMAWTKKVGASAKEVESSNISFKYCMENVAYAANGNNPTTLNFAILTARPLYRARLLRTVAGVATPPNMGYCYMDRWVADRVTAGFSPFTKFFMEELMKVETLVADLIPLWANLGK